MLSEAKVEKVLENARGLRNYNVQVYMTPITVRDKFPKQPTKEDLLQWLYLGLCEGTVDGKFHFLVDGKLVTK
jgi:hypothetical protein